MSNLLTAVYTLAGVAIGFVAGTRFGFVRGMRARLAGAIPPQIAKSRQLTRQFGRGLAKAARRAHTAELGELRELSRKPLRARLHTLLFPIVVLAVALSSSGCEQLTGVKPRAKCLERSYNDTIYLRYQGDTTIRFTLGSCK